MEDRKEMQLAVVPRQAVQLVKRQRAELVFTDEQQKILLDSFMSGASPSEAAALIQVAQARRLDPFKRQIFFVKRWDSGKRCEVWAWQTSIDGYRAIAEDTGLYDGQDEPEYEYADPSDRRLPVLVKVRVYRKDISRPFVGIARYSEYVQLTKEGKPNSMWQKMPHGQLAKCAESLALRKAFPEELGDLHTDDEMGQADADRRLAMDADTQPLSAPQQQRALPEGVKAGVQSQAGAPPPEEVAEWLAQIHGADTLEGLVKIRDDIKAKYGASTPKRIATEWRVRDQELKARPAKQKDAAEKDLAHDPVTGEVEPPREPGEDG